MKIDEIFSLYRIYLGSNKKVRTICSKSVFRRFGVILGIFETANTSENIRLCEIVAKYSGGELK